MDVSTLVYIDSTGFHYADFPTFLAFVQTNYQAIYGADIYLGADSMDGQWTAILAQMLYDTAAMAASTYASFSPTTAQGAGLSRLVKINGLRREIPSNSTAVLTIVGQAGTTITDGIAVDTLGQQWALPTSVVIPGGGSINVTGTSVAPGAIQAGAGTITSIFTPTLGWQSVTNAAAATPGNPVEADSTLRARQTVSTANPSLTVLEGTYGAVANVAGVTDTAVWENETSTTDSNTQPGHSIIVVVQGGSINDVATAIQVHKTPGTNPWSGPTLSGHNQSQVVFDSRGVPVTIGFYQPPKAAEIGVQISLTPGAGWSTDFETTIAAQVAAYINGLGIGAGSQFSGFVRLIPLYAQVYVPNYTPSMYTITGIQIQKNAGGFGSSDIAIDFVSLPSCSPTPGTDVVFIT
jgi:uncharacterized phage protein gp47/JayE